MRVRVKVYAVLPRHFRDVAPGTPFEIELPDDATLADLVNQLQLPREEVMVFFVKGCMRPMDWFLKSDDEVDILPLLGGG